MLFSAEPSTQYGRFCQPVLPSVPGSSSEEDLFDLFPESISHAPPTIPRARHDLAWHGNAHTREYLSNPYPAGVFTQAPPAPSVSGGIPMNQDANMFVNNGRPVPDGFTHFVAPDPTTHGRAQRDAHKMQMVRQQNRESQRRHRAREKANKELLEERLRQAAVHVESARSNRTKLTNQHCELRCKNTSLIMALSEVQSQIQNLSPAVPAQSANVGAVRVRPPQPQMSVSDTEDTASLGDEARSRPADPLQRLGSLPASAAIVSRTPPRYPLVPRGRQAVSEHAAISFKVIAAQGREGERLGFESRLREYKSVVAGKLKARPESVHWHWQWTNMYVTADKSKTLSCPMRIECWDAAKTTVMFILLKLLQSALWVDETEAIEEALRACNTCSTGTGSQMASSTASSATRNLRQFCSDPVPDEYLLCGVNDRILVRDAMPYLLKSVLSGCCNLISPERWRHRVLQVLQYSQALQKGLSSRHLPDFDESKLSASDRVLLDCAVEMERELHERYIPVHQLIAKGASELKDMLDAVTSQQEALLESSAADHAFMDRTGAMFHRKLVSLSCRPSVDVFDQAHERDMHMYKKLNTTATQRYQLANAWDKWVMRVHEQDRRMQYLASAVSGLPNADAVPTEFLALLQQRCLGQLPTVEQPLISEPVETADLGMTDLERNMAALRAEGSLSSSWSPPAQIPASNSDKKTPGNCHWARRLVGVNAGLAALGAQIIEKLQEEQTRLTEAESSIVSDVWLNEGGLTGRQLQHLLIEQLDVGLYVADVMRLAQIAAEQERRQKIFTRLV